MRSSVAVITGIHANLPALQAALARIDELGITPREIDRPVAQNSSACTRDR